MKFFNDNGTLEIFPGKFLFRGMTISDLVGQGLLWEDWICSEGRVKSFRHIFKHRGREIILISNFYAPGDRISGWDLGPENIGNGNQKRPEGKLNNQLRRWFFSVSNINLPQHGDWGFVDAAHDPHNHTTSVICNYRENFQSDKDWLYFLRNNE